MMGWVWKWGMAALLLGAQGCRTLIPDETCEIAAIPTTSTPSDTSSLALAKTSSFSNANNYLQAEATDNVSDAGEDALRGSPPGAEQQEKESKELTLTEVLRLARAANPDLRSASERLELAEALLARARAEFYPRLGVGENFTATNNPVSAFSFLLNQAQLSLAQDFNRPATLGNFHTQVFVEQELYTGGRRLAQVRAAEAQRDAALYALSAVHNELAYRVAEAYYRLLQARDLVEVRLAAVAQVQQHLEIVKVREKAGTAVRSDVLMVEVRLAEVQEALIAARNHLELAWAILENVVGTTIPRRPLPKQVPAAPWGEQLDRVELAVAEALQRRPEVRELASRRLAAQQDIRAAEAGRYPTLSLAGSYDIFTAGDFGKSNDSFLLGIVARVTLFDGGRTRSDIRQAEARFREWLAREQRLALDIELAVRRAFVQLADARERLQVAQHAVKQAEESLREIEVRYKGQTATITQLIDAQVALSNARVRQALAQAEVEIARAALEQAIGRLAEVLSR